jgi:predicted nucleotidyltransferase
MDKLIEKIVSEIDKTNIDFIYLIGSYSRNAHNEFSDIDIIIALKEGHESYNDNQFIDDIYVSLNYDSYAEMQKNYTDPLKYIKGHIGIVDMVSLYDGEDKLEEFRKKCLEIDYLKDFENKINEYVNSETVDWIEEVNKACNGYINNNPSKMIAGLHGLTYGMLNVLMVSEGLISSKDGLLATFKDYFENETTYQLIERAFGVNQTNLLYRTVDGLMLYVDIIDIIDYRFNDLTNYNVNLAKTNILKVLKEVTKDD